jgi:hypothetical protein
MIEDWFDRGVEQGAAYMIVKTDTFDWEDYPVYAADGRECLKVVSKPGDMQKVMEVYDLSASKSEQMQEHRAMRLPSVA